MSPHSIHCSLKTEQCNIEFKQMMPRLGATDEVLRHASHMDERHTSTKSAYAPPMYKDAQLVHCNLWDRICESSNMDVIAATAEAAY